MALSSSNAVRQLSDGNSQGTIYGQSVADTIGFYGTTAVAQLNANTVSISSGALASSLAVALNRLGLVQTSSFLP